MTSENDKVFSRKNVLAKQELAKEEYEKKVQELRVAFKAVAATTEGTKVLRYLFILCGGDLTPARRTKDGVLNVEDTLISIGTKAVWETVRFNLPQELIGVIERHNWEE